MSFRLKTILGIALIEALLLSILIVSGLYYLSSSNAKQLSQRAHTTAKLVATMTADAVVALDLATLDALVESTLRNRDIVYLRIKNESGNVLSQGGQKAALNAEFRFDKSVDDASSDQRLDVSAPITISGKKFGRIELGLSTEALHSTMSKAFQWMAGIAVSEMLLVALMGLALGTYLTHQLDKLKSGAKRVANGELGHLIPINGNDELADTAKSFNKMSASLKDYADMLEEARKKAEAGRELAESILADAVASMRDGLLILDKNNEIALINDAYCRLYDIEKQEISSLECIAKCQAVYSNLDSDKYIYQRLERFTNAESYPRWEEQLNNGRYLLVAQHPISGGGSVIVETDVTELYEALEENKQLQLELAQLHKTETLGALAGGMAHEINTPVQFISDNMSFVAESISDVFSMIDEVPSLEDNDKASVKQQIATKLSDIDWEFIKEEIPSSLDEMSKGAVRVRDLISAFKQFAAPATGEDEYIDIVKAVKTTVEVSKIEWSLDTKVDLDVSDNIPLIPCKVAQINQAIHSLLSNASEAIEASDNKNCGLIQIDITTNQKDIIISIEDNGGGIPVQYQKRIFDNAFSTKGKEKGSGQGLALCHSIISRTHGGTLSFVSKEGAGTTFTITLPLSRSHHAKTSEPLAVVS